MKRFLRRGSGSGSLAGTPGDRINEPPVDLNPYLPGTDVADVAQPTGENQLTGKPETIDVASQWKLMWWRFRRSPLAVLGLVLVILIYLVALFASFLAPFESNEFKSPYTYAPPQRLHLFREGWTFDPWVTGYTTEVNPESLKREYTPDPSMKIDVEFFAPGHDYKLFGLIPMDTHLIRPADPGSPMYLIGSDQNGRDVLSRLIYGTRISMTVGLVGVTLSLFIGILLGGLSGYYGGGVDMVIQRIIEFIGSLPTIPLWLGLAAALPPEWSALRVYFGITVILSFIGWTGLARVVRGRFLSLREEDFVIAAQLDNAKEMRLIFRHMLPSFSSHIIATLTLAIPGMILGETALSFLGLGLRPPIVSWGVLLEGANNVRAIATAPWLLSPAIAVMIAVMALYFLGDGLRDAADPYSA